MDNTLHLLGIAQKAGRLEVGEEPVGAAARARQARVILLACDAAANTARRAEGGRAGNGIPAGSGRSAGGAWSTEHVRF